MLRWFGCGCVKSFLSTYLMKLISWKWIKVFWIRIYELIIDETLVNFIKQGTQQKEKEGQRENTQVWARNTKTNRGHNGAKGQIMFQSFH